MHPTSSTVRTVVIGAGIMGANHVRVGKGSTLIDLVAVVDPDIRKARALATSAGCLAASHIDQVDDAFDFAIVAVPTPLHSPLGIKLAEQGVHVLIEKPLAQNQAEARRLVDACSSNGVTLAVGHVERFNAAVFELPRFVEKPIHIEASRVSPYTPRISDGVVFDLMIHDIDIVLSLLGPDDELLDVSCVKQQPYGASEDLAVATMKFRSGVTSTLTASRLGQQKRRTLEVTSTDSVVVADLLRQDISIHRMARHEYLAEDGARYRTSSVLEIPFLEYRGEPLVNELDHVASNLLAGTRPLVDGQAGLRAIETAELVLGASG